MLRLQVHSSTNPGITPRRLRLENSLLYALAASPLKKNRAVRTQPFARVPVAPLGRTKLSTAQDPAAT